jgi:salicylate hydroxylase
MVQGTRIAIIGAGIGGLTLALALRRNGIDCQIYEAASELLEVGAAVALSGNATRFLDGALNLGSELVPAWYEIEQLVFRDGRTGAELGRHFEAGEYRARYCAPYVGIHRADLQIALSGAVGLDRIQLGRRLTAIDDSGTEAVLTFADGERAAADLVIGADGARSTVRRLLLGYDDALYSGCSGFRGVVDAEHLTGLEDPAAIGYWVGPGGHLLHYPIGSGAHNFLLVERGPAPWPHAGWTAPTRAGEQLDRFADWHPAVTEMISAVPTSERWALFHRPPLGRWSWGRVTLLGDAAHALVPHHGQGANQSIEDAIVLADRLAAVSDLDSARAEYEQLRRGRTRRVQYASITTADVLHLPDESPLVAARNARLAAPDFIERHLDWIHGFVADRDVPGPESGGSWL